MVSTECHVRGSRLTNVSLGKPIRFLRAGKLHGWQSPGCVEGSPLRPRCWACSCTHILPVGPGTTRSAALLSPNTPLPHPELDHVAPQRGPFCNPAGPHVKPQSCTAHTARPRTPEPTWAPTVPQPGWLGTWPIGNMAHGASPPCRQPHREAHFIILSVT